ncbi:tyrosine-protein phosphatase [Streptomyces sp. NPDC087300]|uniref:tyrosine-protein phosphatase n=1 Tax=Streptomyces sp. NPDC087300 TaxID=3365780 RepID=UPI00381A222F
MDRHLNWDGCFNARDLGGMCLRGGGTTRWGAVVRADALDRLTVSGWTALRAHGIRTIVDLRNDEERREAVARPEGITTVHVPLDDSDDTEFWQYCWDNELDGSPLYFRPFLQRKADRCAAAVSEVARARPGGVVIHCGVGRDRTGLIAMLLLALSGVDAGDIADDYELSAARLPGLFAMQGTEDQGPRIQEILERNNTSARAEILGAVAALDFPSLLRAGGLLPEDVAALRARLTGASDG